MMSQWKWKALICLRWVRILQRLTSKLCFCFFGGGGGVLDAGVNPCPPSLTSFSISGQNSSLCSTEYLEWIVILAIPPWPHDSFILMKMCCVPFPKLLGCPRITVLSRRNVFSGICVFYSYSFIFKVFQCVYKITWRLSLPGSASVYVPLGSTAFPASGWAPNLLGAIAWSCVWSTRSLWPLRKCFVRKVRLWKHCVPKSRSLR